MTKRRYFSGDSIEQAVLEAAGHHGLDPRELAWREVEKRHGFLRVRRNVVIEVDPERPRREGRADASEPTGASRVPAGEASGGDHGTVEAGDEPTPAVASPANGRAETSQEPAADQEEVGAPGPEAPGEAQIRREAAPRPPAGPQPPTERQAQPEVPPQDEPEGGEAMVETPPGLPPARVASTEAEVREALELLLELSDLAVDPHVELREGGATVDLRGPEEGFLREDAGELLKVFELLGQRMLAGPDGGLGELRIDSGGFRQQRDEELRRRALEAAREVASSGESKLLEPMDAADRRLVHLAVEEVAGVTTRSEGRGEEKRVRLSREEG